MSCLTNTDLISVPGNPTPLGCSKVGDCINFALYAAEHSSATLQLYLPQEQKPFAQLLLDPKTRKTGKVWHTKIQGLPEAFDYNWVLEDPTKEVIDPYAKALVSPRDWGSTEKPRYWRAAFREDHFNWEGVERPQLHLKDLIIYEMHTRGFTAHPSANVQHPGSFLAIIEKIPYLKDLGINAVELLPIMEFDEREYKPEKQLWQYWGYSTLHFFTPMGRYAVGPDPYDAVREFKQMVRELHRAGIEVILDVVYNHSGEKADHPFTSIGYLDKASYFILDEEGKDTNYTGCGNTLSANHPMMTHLIIESLRYWHLEMGVDGFRFDLASTLSRSPHGTPLSYAPAIEAIGNDPLLANAKMIAEPWDLGGLYEVGHFVGTNPRWAEWNGRYRDTVRKFIKGDAAMAGSFATALCGSPDLYGISQEPWHGINFITAHDGFTLADLVSYNEKHNSANGENNRDGSNQNESWNCGVEGPTDDPNILHLRQAQKRNFMMALLLSQGIPMIRMGDEYGHTQKGNNNTWCQDNELSWFSWEKSQEDSSFFAFIQQLLRARTTHAPFQQEQFLDGHVINWHDKEPHLPDWEPESRIVAFTLYGEPETGPVYVAFNSHHYAVDFILPFDPQKERWYQVIQTGEAHSPSITPFPCGKLIKERTYNLAPYSSLLLQREDIAFN